MNTLSNKLKLLDYENEYLLNAYYLLIKWKMKPISVRTFMVLPQQITRLEIVNWLIQLSFDFTLSRLRIFVSVLFQDSDFIQLLVISSPNIMYSLKVFIIKRIPISTKLNFYKFFNLSLLYTKKQLSTTIQFRENLDFDSQLQSN